MNKAKDRVVAKDTSKLVKAKFGPGMLLQHEDLEQLNIYTRDLSRLMFGSLFGCGVICGLVVKTELKCGKVQVTVGSGLALACSGDPVWVTKDQVFTLDEHCDHNIGARFWVVLCGTTKCCAPRTAICASDEDETPSVCTREIDGFEIKVTGERPHCVCGCKEPEDLTQEEKAPFESECKCVNPILDCYKDHYDGKCGCHCDECSDCECKCILLARLDRIEDTDEFSVDHRVRRFIRPVLMRDPQVEIEQAPAQGQQSLMRKSMERVATESAEKTVFEVTGQKAHDEALKAVDKLATEIGREAAVRVVKRAVEKGSQKGARQVLQTAEQTAPAAEPVAEPAHSIATDGTTDEATDGAAYEAGEEEVQQETGQTEPARTSKTGGKKSTKTTKSENT